MYCLMSALSTNAKSIFSVTFDVVRITTLECLEHEVKKKQKNKQLNTLKGLTDWIRKNNLLYYYMHRQHTLLTNLLIWSSWVRTELTTRMASDGSVPAWQAFLAAVRLSTCPPKSTFNNNNKTSSNKLLKKQLIKATSEDYLPHQSEQTRERLCRQSAVGSSETSL